jgi:hypothetical protein
LDTEARHRICDAVQNEKLRAIASEGLDALWYRIRKLEGTEKEEEKSIDLQKIADVTKEYDEILAQLKCPLDATAMNTGAVAGKIKALIEEK